MLVMPQNEWWLRSTRESIRQLHDECDDDEYDDDDDDHEYDDEDDYDDDDEYDDDSDNSSHKLMMPV